MSPIEQIIEHMERAGIKQADLAAMIGRHPSSVSRALAPNADPRLSIVIEMAHALRIRIIIEPPKD